MYTFQPAGLSQVLTFTVQVSIQFVTANCHCNKTELVMIRSLVLRFYTLINTRSKLCWLRISLFQLLNKVSVSSAYDKSQLKEDLWARGLRLPNEVDPGNTTAWCSPCCCRGKEEKCSELPFAGRHFPGALPQESY